MKILVLAATDFELNPLQTKVSANPTRHELMFHTTGVGILESTYRITELIDQTKPDFALQIGIAGSFDAHVRNGDTIWIESDTIADQGVLENNRFNTLSDLNLLPPNQFPYTNGLLVNPINKPYLQSLKKGSAITINQITTDPFFIDCWNQRYHPTVESMEGAPFHFVCLKKQIPFLQLRAVSNKVGDRNKANWDFKNSFEQLSSVSLQFIESL